MESSTSRRTTQNRNQTTLIRLSDPDSFLFNPPFPQDVTCRQVVSSDRLIVRQSTELELNGFKNTLFY